MVSAVDLDGTLLNDEGSMSSCSASSIRNFNRGGGEVVLATGQPLMAVKSLVDGPLSGCGIRWVICSGGASVMERMGQAGWRERFRNGIAADVTEDVLRRLSSQLPGLEIACDCADAWLVNTNKFFDSLEVGMPGVGRRLSKLGRESGNVSELFHMGGFPDSMRILGIHNAMEKQDLWDALQRVIDEVNGLFGSDLVLKDPGVPGKLVAFEILSRTTNKATALRQVCQVLGVAKTHVTAFGDQENDREMIEWAGVGIAVGNAKKSIKHVADKVLVRTNNQNAVATEFDHWHITPSFTLSAYSRLKQNVNEMAEQIYALEAENIAMQKVIEDHEKFVDLVTARSPRRFESPIRKRKSTPIN